MLRWITVTCVFILLISSFTFADDDNEDKKDPWKWETEKTESRKPEPRKPIQSVIRLKEMPSVNSRFTDDSDVTLDEFKEKMPDFDESDSFEDVEDEDLPKGQTAQRELGGFVLNLGKFSNGKYSPGNILGARYVSHIISDACKPAAFPYTCKVNDLIDEKLKCPLDVPYCQRIPCIGERNDVNNDFERCVKQPGCCFDWTLWNYRRFYGQTVLPRVPVCHQAVRNNFFHKMAEKFKEEFRGWNPLLTTCLIKSYEKKIVKNVLECSSLEIFEMFGYLAKHAGWKRISPRECGLIGGCWRATVGCFYPPRMTGLQLRSSYEHPRSRPTSPFDLYGQPMCLPFDPHAKSEDFLTQYHQCLASGCSLDPAVTPNAILFHLNNISSQIPKNLVSGFKYEVMLGKIRPDNWRYQLNHFQKYGQHYKPAPVNVFGPQRPPQTNLPPNLLAYLGKFPGPSPNYAMGGYQTSPVSNPMQLLNSITSGQSYPNPARPYVNPNLNAYINPHPFGPSPNQFGAPRTYQNPNGPRHFQYQPTVGGGNMYQNDNGAKLNLFPMPCPYQLIRIPNFPPLEGRLDDCCDRNLCYLSRESVSHQYSGASAYWGPWGFWSRCNTPCGNAVQKRFRSCVGPNPRSCAGPAQDQRGCVHLPSCREKMSKWSTWSKCEKDCGGNRFRTRKCMAVRCIASSRERSACPKKCEDKTPP